jgi:LysW-gamma-L-lysine carboxypeptidase
MTTNDITLLKRLVDIPSVSRQETDAVASLVAWMNDTGFAARIDAAGNAVGILDGGTTSDHEPCKEIILLGHIDTVPGDIPVRIEDGKLYGRGTVDAKGPLAAFAVAAARVGVIPGWRIIVIGAVEEEAATSKGAKYVATQYSPDFAIIGEPSSWQRVTLGYKGRLLVDASVRKRMMHTATPESSVVEDVVDYWIRVKSWASALNEERKTSWEWVMATIRHVDSGGDGIDNWATMRLGIRLPLDISPDDARTMLTELANGVELVFSGGEPALRVGRKNALVRAFLTSIRTHGERPGFVLKTGTSDMNVVGPVWQCPIVAYGAGDSSLDHTPTEHVEITEWRTSVDVLQGVLLRLTASV